MHVLRMQIQYKRERQLARFGLAGGVLVNRCFHKLLWKLYKYFVQPQIGIYTV